MRFNYNEKQLRSNSHVRKVDLYTLTLSTELRVRLYKEWRQNKEEGAFVRILEESGIGEEVTGLNYYKTLITGFKNGGYPVYKNNEITLVADYREENPLLTSGRFTRSDIGRGTSIATDFVRELFSHYPEMSVEEGIRRAGLDPKDVGYQRVQMLKKEFEARAKKLYEINESERKTAFGKETDKEVEVDVPANLVRHPYIRKMEGTLIIIREAFYNESYLIGTQPLDEILKMYDLEPSWFSQQNKILIHSKLYHWKPTGDEVKEIQIRCS